MYSKSSTAGGALFSFVFITDSGDVDFSRSFLLALDRNTSRNYTLPFNLYPGHYRVYVYDIERDGTLHSGVGYPAVTEELSTNSTNSGIVSIKCFDNTSSSILCIDKIPLQPYNCTLSSTSGLIWAECSHPDSSFADGIQVIVQSTNVSEVHKLYVNQSMDLHTPVSVSVGRDGDYEVSIFAIREGIVKLEYYTGQAQYNVMIVSVTDITTVQGDFSTSSQPRSDSEQNGRVIL